MLFNSIDFIIYLPTVFILYWFALKKNLKLQNILIVISSYVFYGWWDYRFLSLIIFSTIVDYTVGLAISKQENIGKRKALLIVSLTLNLGLLGFFKYYNFFIESFTDAFTLLGADIKPSTLNIILPVGISFYTFQTLSYTIDIYKRKLVPETNYINFSAFVCFFPQLVAGPIERATHLLPQFKVKKELKQENISEGLKLITWGLFKKVVVADRLAEYVTILYDDPGQYYGLNVILGTIFFSFQIYYDFSAYSEIAIGTSKLLGFNLSTNFNRPYSAKSLKEFWSKWHISLTNWFKDYLYIPLGGNRTSKRRFYFNISLVFLLSGIWHGANWTFIIWGLLHATLWLIEHFVQNQKKSINTGQINEQKPVNSVFYKVFIFCLVNLTWIFFRSNTVADSLVILKNLLQINTPFEWVFSRFELAFSIVLILFVQYIEFLKGKKNRLNTSSVLIKNLYYYFLILMILFFGVYNNTEFIYFKF